jgi:hypothetical protein
MWTWWPKKQDAAHKSNALVRFAFVSCLLLSWYHQEIMGPSLLFLLSLILLFLWIYNPTRESFAVPDKTKCRVPTSQNPFMNPSAIEMISAPPCDIDLEEVEDQVNEYSKRTRYSDADDAFDRNHAFERFNTIPLQDVDAYMKFVFPIGKTCKEDNQCIQFEDIRYS